MLFRGFLERERNGSRRARGHALSATLHLLGLLALVLVSRAMDSASPDSPPALPALAVSLFQPAPAPAPALSPTPPAAQPELPRSPRPRPRLSAGLRPADAASAPATIATASELVGAQGLPGGGASGSGDSLLAGGGPRRRRAELFARVIGSGIARGTPVRADRPFVSLKEATALRTYDYFPRLPAALWPERRPYVVSIELCVSEDGLVSEAALLSSGSPLLDPLVLDAVRSWRYRPRLLGGRPAAFCHGVAIKYEPGY